MARDQLLPAALARVQEKSGSPMAAQAFCGGLAAFLALLFDVDKLSKILSIGTMAAYTVVCASVVALRFSSLPPASTQQEEQCPPTAFASAAGRSVFFGCVGMYAAGVLEGLAVGSSTVAPAIVGAVLAVGSVAQVQRLFAQHPHAAAPLSQGFSCPAVRLVPLLGLAFNGARPFPLLHPPPSFLLVKVITISF